VHIPIILTITVQIVPKDSAVVPGTPDAHAIALHKNHIDLVKFKSEDDHGFKAVTDQISVMVKNAGSKIKSNWDHELMHTNKKSEWVVSSSKLH
jgi:hypothetical protein